MGLIQKYLTSSTVWIASGWGLGTRTQGDLETNKQMRSAILAVRVILWDIWRTSLSKFQAKEAVSANPWIPDPPPWRRSKEQEPRLHYPTQNAVWMPVSGTLHLGSGEGWNGYQWINVFSRRWGLRAVTSLVACWSDGCDMGCGEIVLRRWVDHW